MLKIKTMDSIFTEDYVAGILENRDENIIIDDITRLYYPYVKLLYSFKLNGKLSKLNRQMLCSVDLVYGRHAIGQGKPSFIEIDVDSSLVLPAEIKEEKTLIAARNYVFKIFLSKMKILQTPEISLDEMEYFYKLFFVAHCKDPEGVDYYILVDSMDGNIVILDC